MKATIMRDSGLLVQDIEAPEPGPGEVLVKTLACGICGSDLHALQHADQFSAMTQEIDGPMKVDLSRDLVMGHEFCAEILDYGPDTQKVLKPGTRVCSMPVLLRPGNIQNVGYSNHVPGGYGEQMLLSEPLLLEVPKGLPTDMAALTEPMAVGLHAVQMARLTREDIPLIIGCGPVGLAVLSALKMMNIGPVIAADFSPSRRKAAELMGADVVIDPAEKSPYQSWQEFAGKNLKGEDIPLDPMTGTSLFRPGVFFECVGIPGIIDQMMQGAQRGCRFVIVGVCMQEDHFQPLRGITRELNIQFVLGYTAEEFTETLHNIADGKTSIEGLITSNIGIDDVPQAFETLANPEKEIKIMVEPWR